MFINNWFLCCIHFCFCAPSYCISSFYCHCSEIIYLFNILVIKTITWTRISFDVAKTFKLSKVRAVCAFNTFLPIGPLYLLMEVGNISRQTVTCLQDLGLFLCDSSRLAHSTLVLRKYSELVSVAHDEVRDGGIQSVVMLQHSEIILENKTKQKNDSKQCLVNLPTNTEGTKLPILPILFTCLRHISMNVGVLRGFEGLSWHDKVMKKFKSGLGY